MIGKAITNFMTQSREDFTQESAAKAILEGCKILCEALGSEVEFPDIEIQLPTIDIRKLQSGIIQLTLVLGKVAAHGQLDASVYLKEIMNVTKKTD